MKEISYVMIKPGFANLVPVIDEVKQRIFEAGLKITNEAFAVYSQGDVRKHYVEHLNREDYCELEKFIMSDKVYGMQVEGEDAIRVVRTIMGTAKDPAPGTIRHDIPEVLGIILPPTQNVAHASDSIEAAKRELAIFNEIVERMSQEKY